ncbi:MAG: OsmC family protein [Saprospiraceae bacterium]
MKMELRRLDTAYHMQATNEEGQTVETDGSPSIGGSNKGMRPMQLMLVGLGSCSSIDIIHLLTKQRQPLEDIQISIDSQRAEGEIPSLFTAIQIHYRLYGDLDEKKVERAVTLSMEKLCSVAKILEKTAKITWSWEIIA